MGHQMDTQFDIWLMSIVGAISVGLTSIAPLVVIPFLTNDNSFNFKSEKSRRTLKLMLSFAVGSLLGDVFLHLLPEAWAGCLKASNSLHTAHLLLGCWVLIGIFTFILIEIIFSAAASLNQKIQLSEEKPDKNANESKTRTKNMNGGDVRAAGDLRDEPDLISSCHDTYDSKKTDKHNSKSYQKLQENDNQRSAAKIGNIEIAGYLNIIANGIDNFTHGLAVAAGFLINFKVGLLTTIAIIIHEIPHEVGDFAILMKSGFKKWDAVRAQLSTASIGVLGVIFALSTNSMDSGSPIPATLSMADNPDSVLINDITHTGEANLAGLRSATRWILPFTAGGFLHIALVNILPDLLRETNPKESLKQLMFMALGIVSMWLVSSFTE